ncbi:MAG: vitamin B12 dependent-methionine synthase activation domain-containing protein [Dialister sp.]|nr:vitamin B12 dependent-methionine synthase activation domain-containing protein [Dialister sp.]
MPFYNGTLFEIDRKEMLRYAGVKPGGKNFPDKAVEQAIEEALALAKPKGIWRVLPYTPSEGRIEGIPPLVLEGTSIRRHLETSWSVAMLTVTAGDDIEQASANHFKAGEYALGLLLDACATTVTEHLADQVDRLIQKAAAKDGQKTVWRFSPGYGNWPVTQQHDFCRLIEADKIGVHVTDHAMLFPRKSVSAIIGISQCAQSPAPAKCRVCSLVTCPFRH